MQQIQQINENAQREVNSLKSANFTSDTPMKLPFKDTTNNSTEKNVKISNDQCTNPTISDFKDFEFMCEFQCAKNLACFCCGEKRKLDGEYIYENLVSAEFLEALESAIRLPEWNIYDNDDIVLSADNLLLIPMVDFKKIDDYKHIENDSPFIPMEELLLLDIEFDPQFSDDSTDY